MIMVSRARRRLWQVSVRSGSGSPTRWHLPANQLSLSSSSQMDDPFHAIFVADRLYALSWAGILEGFWGNG